MDWAALLLLILIATLLAVRTLSRRASKRSISCKASIFSTTVGGRVLNLKQGDPTPQIPDHSNIARAYAALGPATSSVERQREWKRSTD